MTVTAQRTCQKTVTRRRSSTAPSYGSAGEAVAETGSEMILESGPDTILMGGLEFRDRAMERLYTMYILLRGRGGWSLMQLVADGGLVFWGVFFCHCLEIVLVNQVPELDVLKKVIPARLGILVLLGVLLVQTRSEIYGSKLLFGFSGHSMQDQIDMTLKRMSALMEGYGSYGMGGSGGVGGSSGGLSTGQSGSGMISHDGDRDAGQHSPDIPGISQMTSFSSGPPSPSSSPSNLMRSSTRSMASQVGKISSDIRSRITMSPQRTQSGLTEKAEKSRSRESEWSADMLLLDSLSNLAALDALESALGEEKDQAQETQAQEPQAASSSPQTAQTAQRQSSREASAEYSISRASSRAQKSVTFSPQENTFSEYLYQHIRRRSQIVLCMKFFFVLGLVHSAVEGWYFPKGSGRKEGGDEVLREWNSYPSAMHLVLWIVGFVCLSGLTISAVDMFWFFVLCTAIVLFLLQNFFSLKCKRLALKTNPSNKNKKKVLQPPLLVGRDASVPHGANHGVLHRGTDNVLERCSSDVLDCSLLVRDVE